MGKKILITTLLVLSICCNSANAHGLGYDAYNNAPASAPLVKAEFTEYMKNVKSKLNKNWVNPDFLEEGKVRVVFKLDRNGNLISEKVSESSGDPIYDEAAIDAIKKSAPFGKFPAGTERESITINYSFNSSLVKTDKMKEYYKLAKANYYTNRKLALKYINLAIEEVNGDDEGYFLYKRRGKIKEAMGDYVSAKEDYQQYEKMKKRIDIKRIHALKRRAEVEDTAFAYYYLAYSYEMIKDYDNAIAAIDKAIERTDLNNNYKRYKAELIKKRGLIK